MTRGILVLGLAVCLARGALAQGVVTGTVRDAFGLPVAGAQVLALTARIQAFTDADGRFRLAALVPGAQQLLVRRVGFRADTTNILVPDQAAVTLDIVLETLPVTLAAIDVTPSRFGVGEQVAATSATLTRDDIDALPQLGEDVYRAVGRLPGLASHDYSARFWVRGAPNEEVLARLDGVELVDPFHMKDFEGALSVVDVETIGRLDLVTGGFTTDYGDHLAGLMLLETLAPGTARPRTTIGLSLNTLRATSRGEFAGGRGRWLAAARRGYLDIVLGLIGADQDIDPTYYDLAAKVEYDVGDAHTVSAHVLHASDQLSYQDEDDPRLTSDYRSSYAWFGWRGGFGPRLTGTAVLSVSDHQTSRGGAGVFDGRDTMSLRDEREYRLAGLRQDWSLVLHERAMLRFGLEVRTQDATYDYHARRRLPIVRNDSLVVVTDSTDLILAADGPVAGLYLAPRVRPFGPLTIEAGIRVDRQSPPGGTRTSPRLNAALTLGRTTWRAAWGAYDQPHSLYRLDVPDGDSAIRGAERSEHHIVGIEHAFGNALRARLEVYERISTRLRPRYVDPLVTSDVFPEFSPSRVRLDPSQGRARGVELLVERRTGGRFGWSAYYALAEADEQVQGRWVPRQRDQRHTITLDASIAPSPAWQISAAWYFHSGWPVTRADFVLDTLSNSGPVLTVNTGPLFGERLPAYHRMDVRVTRRFQFRRSVLRVFVEAFNLYDRGNAEGYDYAIRVQGNQLIVNRGYELLLPRLPSFGVSWEF